MRAIFGVGTQIRFSKKSNNQCVFYLLLFYYVTFRLFFLTFLVSKLQRIEVFHTGLVYYQ